MDDLLEDMANDEPPPEPIRHRSSTQTLPILLQWFISFLLFWQATCKIRGLELQLRFMFQFMHVIGITLHSEYLCQMSLTLPSSPYLLRKFVNLKYDNFIKFAVCPKCASLYNLKVVEGYLGVRLSQISVTTAHLAKVVWNSIGKKSYLSQCFNSLIHKVEGLLKRPGVPEMCEQWRERVADVYDGSIWRDFLKHKGTDFLNAPRNLAFTINVDWSQPFKRRNDRFVGDIYLVLLNFSREQRFKWENIIVAGVVPEMNKSLNTFLVPIVDERHFGRV